MYTSDWTAPPQTRGEWYYRLGITLMLTLQRPIRSFPIDVGALYDSGVTYWVELLLRWTEVMKKRRCGIQP